MASEDCAGDLAVAKGRTMTATQVQSHYKVMDKTWSDILTQAKGAAKYLEEIPAWLSKTGL